MSNSQTVIYVSQNIGPSSMPYNEFYCGRCELYPEVNCHFVAYDEKITEQLKNSKYQNSNIHLCRLDRDDIHLAVENLVKKLGQSSNVIVHSHDPRITPNLTSVLRPYRDNVRVFHTVHNNFQHQGLKWQINTIQSIIKSDFTTFCSESSLANFPLRWLFQKKISAIPNGVDLDRIKEAKKGCISAESNSSTNLNSRIKLVTVTKASTQKNTDFLIRVAHSLQDKVSLKIIGNLSKSTNNILNNLPATNIETTGVIKRSEVYCHFMNSDIFVSSSLWEGLPIGVLEAMACKLPVILSDIPAHREIVNKENSAYDQYNISGRPTLLDTNPLLWKNEVDWFVNNSSIIDKIGDKNEAFVSDHFSLKKMHEKYTAVYDKLYE